MTASTSRRHAETRTTLTALHHYAGLNSLAFRGRFNYSRASESVRCLSCPVGLKAMVAPQGRRGQKLVWPWPGLVSVHARSGPPQGPDKTQNG